MSGFLSNLAARARGTLPRLAPRRPGPFETLGDRSEPFDSDMPVPSVSVGAPARAPRIVEAVSPARMSAPVAGPTIPAAATVPNATHTAPPPVTPATPAPAALARRMMTLSPTAAVAPAALASTQAITPPVAASPHAVLTAEASLVAHAPVSPPIASAAPAAVITPGTVGDVIRDRPGGRARTDPELDASPIAPDGRPASRPSIAPVPRAPPPLLPREDAAPRPAGQIPQGKDAIRTAKPQQPPHVEVHIGTIEVVMDPPKAMQPAPATTHSRGISLDDFLDGRGGR